MAVRFGDHVLDEDRRELCGADGPIALEPQAFDVLVHLVRHRDRVVSKDELMDAVWGGRFVSETAVTTRVKQVRRALGDDGRLQGVVRTLHGRGYRFVAEVSTSDAGRERPATAPRPPRYPVRYTVSDGLHVAYQVSGGGDVDVVLISGFVSHLELDWGDPRHAHFLDRLGAMGRLIRFDKRGTGMSDRPPGVPDLEERMHDVLAVMDAVGSERAVLCGYSEGGPMAVLMAATHPERVHSLVLYGTYARRTWAPDHDWAQTQEQRAVYTEQLLRTWDWEADIRMRCPSADEAMQRWWALRMRAAATPGTIEALMEMNSLVDVRDLLASVQVPTLVVHRTEDPLFAVREGRYLADRIPGARLVEIPGDAHFVAGDPDQILDVVEPFVRATPRPRHDLALAAVVCVAGPGEGTALAALVDAGGRCRHAVDGELVVLFDGPATAVRAALEVEALLPTVGTGLGIAEVAVGGGPVGGPGVAGARALASEAPPGELWASSVAGTLLASSGLRLAALGAGALRVTRGGH